MPHRAGAGRRFHARWHHRDRDARCCGRLERRAEALNAPSSTHKARVRAVLQSLPHIRTAMARWSSDGGDRSFADVGRVGFWRLIARSRRLLLGQVANYDFRDRCQIQYTARTINDPITAATTSRSEIDMRSRAGKSPNMRKRRPPITAPAKPIAMFRGRPKPLRSQVIMKPTRLPPISPTTIQTMIWSNVGISRLSTPVPMMSSHSQVTRLNQR